MTKDEMLVALENGKRVRHTSFSQSELMERFQSHRYIFEDGCICSEPDFWFWRTGSEWLTGWSIVK